MEIEYWHWVILGITLIAAEMLLPSFILLWFGAGAILTGLSLWLIPLSISAQVTLWTCSSIAFTVAWFKFLKPLSIDKTNAGLPAEKIVNETGMVIKAPANGQRGMVRFTTPKLGNEEWQIISDDIIQEGDRVRVTQVSGNTLVVVKS